MQEYNNFLHWLTYYSHFGTYSTTELRDILQTLPECSSSISAKYSNNRRLFTNWLNFSTAVKSTKLICWNIQTSIDVQNYSNFMSLRSLKLSANFHFNYEHGKGLHFLRLQPISTFAALFSFSRFTAGKFQIGNTKSKCSNRAVTPNATAQHC